MCAASQGALRVKKNHCSEYLHCLGCSSNKRRYLKPLYYDARMSWTCCNFINLKTLKKKDDSMKKILGLIDWDSFLKLFLTNLMKFCRIILCLWSNMSTFVWVIHADPREDAARLQYFAKNSRCSSLGWVRGSSRPRGTTRNVWPRQRQDGRSLFEITVSGLAFILHRDTVGPALLNAQNTKQPHLIGAPATEKLRCTQGCTLTAHIYSFVFVGVNTQHIFDWGRARGILSYCLQVSAL